MEEILHCVAQPVWVVDAAGMISFVNPAGVAALGYDSLSELQGRPGHDTIHYKHPDGSPYPASECPMSRSRDTGTTFSMDEDWFVRRDGTMFPVAYTSTPIDTPDGLGLVVAFSDIADRRRAERAARERDVAEARATEHRAAQRRIIEAADAARAQLERDLHDAPQQHFVSAVLYLQMAARKDGTDPDGARALREQAIALANTGVVELRRLAAGVHPAPPGGGDPPPAAHRARAARGAPGARRRAAAAGRGRRPRGPAARAGRGQRLLLRQRGAGQRRQARAGVGGDGPRDG